MNLSRRTYVPLFLQTVKIYIFQSHQSPSGPVYTRKTLQVFRIYKTVWFEHENTFQNYQTKKATYTIQNGSQATRCLPFTAFYSTQPQTNLTMTTSTSGMHLSRRTNVSLFLQTVNNIYFNPTSPLLVLSTPEKHYKFFVFTRLFDLNMKTHFKTTRRKRLRIPCRTNLRRY